jgi:VanZ family protein
MESKMNRRSIILIIIWVLIIFSFSLQSGYSSNAGSSEVKDTLAPIVHRLDIKVQPLGAYLMQIYHDKNVTPGAFLFRKVAHLTEYLILGIIVMLSIKPYRQKIKRLWLLAILIGPSVSLIDELIIQAYLSSGRTASLYDVAIDSSGFLIGTALICLMHQIRRKTHLFEYK